jgi:hypothetical protein
MSTGRMPYAFNSRTRDASIEGGRPKESPDSRALSKPRQASGAQAGNRLILPTISILLKSANFIDPLLHDSDLSNLFPEALHGHLVSLAPRFLNEPHAAVRTRRRGSLVGGRIRATISPLERDRPIRETLSCGP